MKDIEKTVDAIMTLRENAETAFEKGTVEKFIDKLLNPPEENLFEEKICPVCGKKFFQNHQVQKFCSAKCRRYNENHHKFLVEKICLNCGKKFQSNKYLHRQFCSQKCSNQYHFKKK